MNSISTVNPKTTDWHAIDWQVAHDRVRNLRQRIYKARLNGDWKKVRGLQKLMLRSRANLLVSVRRATQINRGKTTPGVDRYVALVPAERERLIETLSTLKTWEPLPAKRVYYFFSLTNFLHTTIPILKKLKWQVLSKVPAIQSCLP